MASLIWAVPLCPLIGVLINGLLLSGMGPAVRQRWSGWIATLASAAAFVFALVVFSQLNAITGAAHWHDSTWYLWIDTPLLKLPMALRIDPLSMVMTLVVTGVGSLIHLYSIGYMQGDERYGRYFTYLNLFMFAMLILVLANNYALMFVGWEGVGLCSYLLIGFFFERVSAAQAGKKAFLINRVGDFAFLLGMFALFWNTIGEPGAAGLVFNTPDHKGALDLAGTLIGHKLWGQDMVTVICLLLLIGATGKSAQLPLYMWLPDAMEGPTPVSALIHAATMVTAGVYMIARSAALYELSPTAQLVVAVIGVVTAAYAAILAMKQYDIKRVLAYSTISQLGYMFVGVGVGAYAAGISHLVTHAFFKALLFLGAGAVMHALDGQLDLRKMGNLKRYLPVTFITFLIGWWAICGLPPFAGFFSKDAILDSVLERSHEHPNLVPVYWLGVVVAALTAFYMTRMFVTVFFGSERIQLGDEGHGGDAQEHGHSHADDHGHSHDHGHTHDHAPAGGHGHAHVHPESAIMNLPLIVLAILSALGGVVVFALPHFLGPLWENVIAGAGEHTAETLHWSWSALYSPPSIAAYLGVGVAWFAFGPEKFARGANLLPESVLGAPQAAYDGLMYGIFVCGGNLIAQLLTIVDRLIDGIVGLVAAFVDYLAESLRTLQTGYVRNYALVMLAGAVFVIACFMLILQPWRQNIPAFWIWVIVAALVLMAVVFAFGQRSLPEDETTENP